MTSPIEPLAESHSEPLKPIPEQTAELDRSLVHGIGWTAAAKWITQLLTWPATVLVVRLLSPDDFGILGMAALFMGLVALVNEFGLGSAIVKHRDLTYHQIAQINGLCVLFGVAAMAAGLVAAYPLAVFYHTPALTEVVLALSINFLITGFKTIPLALMQRDLQFRSSAINEAVGAVVQSGSLVLFAWLGMKYWSLVLSTLLGSVVTTAMAYAQRPHGLARPRRADIGEAMTFGGHFMGGRLAWYVYSNADFFVVGRVLGQTALGNYGLGWELATLPVEKVTSLIGRVSPPIFSAVQTDHASMRRYLSRIAGGIALIAFPAGVGLALVAPDFVRLALGDKWLAAITPLQILAVYGAFRSIMPMIGQVGTVVGLNQYVMRNSVMAAVLLPIAFFVGSRWGTTGVATAWILAYPIVAVPLGARVFRQIQMSAREFLVALWPALSSVALFVPIVLLLKILDSAEPIAARLAIEVVAGVLTYILSITRLHRGSLDGLLRLVPPLRRRSASV